MLIQLRTARRSNLRIFNSAILSAATMIGLVGCAPDSSTPSQGSTTSSSSATSVASPDTTPQFPPQIVDKGQLRLKTRDEAIERLTAGLWKPRLIFRVGGYRSTDPINTADLKAPEYGNLLVKSVCFYSERPREVSMELIRREDVAFVPEGTRLGLGSQPTNISILAGQFENDQAYEIPGDTIGCDMSKTGIDIGNEPPAVGPKSPFQQKLVTVDDLILKTRADGIRLLNAGKWWPTIYDNAYVQGDPKDAGSLPDLGPAWDDAKIIDVCFIKGSARSISLTYVKDVTPEIERKAKNKEYGFSGDCDRSRASVDIGNFPPLGR